MEALIADINLLYQNCLQFNSETAPIVLIAEELKLDLMKIIYPDQQLASLENTTNEHGEENHRAESRGR